MGEHSGGATREGRFEVVHTTAVLLGGGMCTSYENPKDRHI